MFSGHTEIILIVLLVLLLFGAKRLPELARSLGKAITEFKRGTKDLTDHVDSADNADSGDDGRNQHHR